MGWAARPDPMARPKNKMRVFPNPIVPSPPPFLSQFQNQGIKLPPPVHLRSCTQFQNQAFKGSFQQLEQLN
ncbi:hypothetical protein V6Z11_D01G040600 [Gossypium hirsutum]